jgi:hypothetical protein
MFCVNVFHCRSEKCYGCHLFVCMQSFYDVWQRLSTPSLQRSLSSQFPSRRRHSSIAVSTPSFHLVFGLPLFLLPIGIQFNVLGNLSSAILWRCPYQTNCFAKMSPRIVFLYQFFFNYFISNLFPSRCSCQSAPKAHFQSQ